MSLRFCLSILALAWAGTSLTIAAEPIELGTRLEPLVDDFLIQEINGDVAQQLQRPEPREVVLVTDQPWEGNTSAYYTVFRDDDRFRMYYRGSHFDEATRKAAHREVTCYAESEDGIHWVKPNLGLIEFDGSKENNIVWDGIGSHCFTVFKDDNPDCAPEAKYKAISRGRPLAKRGLYIFQSPDGLRWSLMRPEPVIVEGAFDSQNLAFWDSHAKRYREYHRTFTERVRAIMTSTSDDYVNWSEPVLLRYPDAPAQHLYTNAVMPYPGAPHLLIGFPTRYLPAEGERVEPIFMTSRDGVTFQRWSDPLIPETAPQDRSGNRSNYMAWGLVQLPQHPGRYSVYATEAYYTGPDSRLRRFEYRQDGLVAITGGVQGGELVTKPILLGELADRLTINFRTHDTGSLRVALETPAGKPLAGYEAENCIPLRGDSLQANVTWSSGADLSALRGQVVQLRFYLQQADLFALQFQPWLR